MRNLSAILLFLLTALCFQMEAQNIIQAEYYIDEDPGMGNGIAITIANAANPSTTLTLETDALPIGLHRVGVRVKNENDEWGITAVTTIRVQSDFTEVPLMSGEYFWDDDPGIGQANAFLVNPTQSLNEQISFSTTDLDIGEHRLGVRLMNQAGIWSHYITEVVEVCAENPALAGFLFFKDNQTVLCSDTSLYADSVFYIIEQGETELALINQPNVNFELETPGQYAISQIAVNACNQDTSKYDFFIRGIDRIFPVVSGRKTLVIADIYGGFDEVSSVFLDQGGSQIQADEYNVINPGLLRATFWIDELATLGAYDVVVENPLGSDVLAEGFTVEESTGFDPSSYITGRTRFLTNIWTTIRIYIQNHGNSTEYAVPIYIGMPGEVEARVLNPIVGGDSLPAYILDRFALNEFFIVEEDGSSTSFILLNKPFMRPGELSYIDMEMRTASTQEFRVFTAFGKGIYTAEEIYGFDEFGRSSCTFLNPCIQDVMDGLGFVPTVGCVTSAFSLGCSLGNFVDEATDGDGAAGLGGAFLNNGLEALGVLTCGAGNLDEATNFGLMVINWGLGAGSIGAGALPGGGGGAGGGGGGPGSSGPDPCGSCASSEGCGGGNAIFQPASSLDPNDKSGPLGPTSNNFINGHATEIQYRINFENVDTATAPAREVFVYDTLDQTYLDIENFRFTSLSFSDSTYVFEAGVADTFIRDFDLRPSKNTILRVEGKIDPVDGVVSICYKSLDPETMDLTLDVDAGFLNPNVNGTEGQGYFEFIIGTKNLNHLDVIENTAAIVFDANDAIVTNTWWNTVDDQLPESRISDVQVISWIDSTHLVMFDNSDMHSGFNYLDLWLAKDDEDYILIGRNLRQDSVKVKLEPNANYKFLSLGADRVLNFEDVPADPVNDPDYEYSTIVSSIDDEFSDNNRVDIFPNPSNGNLAITIEGSDKIIDAVSLFSLDGRLQSQWMNVAQYELLSVEDMEGGIYVIELQLGSEAIFEKVVIVDGN